MLKSNGVWMPPGMTCARAVWAEPPICTGNWNVWQYCVRETPIVVRPVWLTSAPLRLLPIKLTVEPLATLASGVVPAVPRITLNVVELGRVAADLDVFGVPGRRVDELKHVVVHQERRVGGRDRGL